jgi:MFS family permease
MEDMARLGDLALKLEKYRYNIASAMAWVIFGMVFGSMNILGNSLILFGILDYRVFWVLVVIAGIISGYVYQRILKYMPREKEVEKRWRGGIILLFTPFIVFYALLPQAVNVSALYFNTIWYLSLGLGLFLCGLYTERKPLIRVMTYAGILIVLSSIVLYPISKLPMSFNIIIASGLLCLSMMLLIYFTTAMYIFFKAEKIVHA